MTVEMFGVEGVHRTQEVAAWMKGWVGTNFEKRVEGVYRHKRLQDKGGAWVGTCTQS